MTRPKPPQFTVTILPWWEASKILHNPEDGLLKHSGALLLLAPPDRIELHRRALSVVLTNEDWATACKAAGVAGRTRHDLRRTAVRNMERQGVPRSVAMQLTGHSTESVYRRYAIVSPGDLQEAPGSSRARRRGSATPFTAPFWVWPGKPAV